MFHGWENWQWAIYAALNLGTAYSYFVLPWRARRVTFVGYPFTMTDSLLFQLFVFCCGVHHLTHPAFMYFDWFWSIAVVDGVMMSVSIVAAHKMPLGREQ